MKYCAVRYNRIYFTLGLLVERHRRIVNPQITGSRDTWFESRLLVHVANGVFVAIGFDLAASFMLTKNNFLHLTNTNDLHIINPLDYNSSDDYDCRGAGIHS